MIRTFRLMLSAGILFLSFSASANAMASNKWRIEVSEGAKSSGEIVFRFSPKGGVKPFDVAVPIADGTGENAVAGQIRDAFQAKLGSDGYDVEVDDGEDVLVKKRLGQESFDLAVVRNTVKAVRIELDRE
jgi:hypothetical protein